MIELVQTCGACPEQYDAYLNGQNVGYLRLRHGFFYAQCNGETVYEAHPRGDGCFDSEERTFYLNRAVEAIEDRLVLGNKAAFNPYYNEPEKYIIRNEE